MIILKMNLNILQFFTHARFPLLTPSYFRNYLSEINVEKKSNKNAVNNLLQNDCTIYNQSPNFFLFLLRIDNCCF